jgi:NodT family efflux transporter outer membrane factor (OMF) lipoprotein
MFGNQNSGHEFEKLLARIRLAVRGILALLMLPMAAGCAGHFQNWWHNDYKVGPEYMRPAAQVADDWIDADEARIVSEKADHSEWWTVFDDPVLNRLVSVAYTQNLSLREAALRVLEARYQLGIAQHDLLPQQQSANFDYQKIQVSKSTSPNNSLPPALGGPRAFDFLGLGFNLGWELDVWGRYRRLIETANADLDVQIEDYDDVLVTLVADVATAYMQVRILEQQLAFTQQNIVSQTESRRIAKVKFDVNNEELDLQQAEAFLAETQSTVPALQAAKRRAQNLICVLLGIPPRDLTTMLGPPPALLPNQNTDEPWMIPTSPTKVAVGIPAELLRRRPDIRRAEREIAAQSALIGVAAADLFPSFSILGSIQLQSEKLSDLFSASSTAGFIGAPGVDWKILHYGRIRNNINVQDARFQQLVARYENAVLRAGQEIEDALIDYLRAQDRYAIDLRAVKAAKRASELALIKYKGGEDIEFNTVATLDNTLARDQDQLARTQGEITTSLIRIFKALGGGWQIRLEDPSLDPAEELDALESSDDPPVAPPQPPEDTVPEDPNDVAAPAGNNPQDNPNDAAPILPPPPLPAAPDANQLQLRAPRAPETLVSRSRRS